MPLPFRAGALVALAVASLTGCAGRPEPARLTLVATPRACRAPAADAGPGEAVQWFLPADHEERRTLDRWCETVGPPLVRQASQPPRPADLVAVVTWNVHVGGGDVERLVAQLRRGALTGGRPVEHVVLLLQEAFRAGPGVPARMQVAASAVLPAPILPALVSRPTRDVSVVAERLGLALYYVPSMRNGPPSLTSEDRGNAILSTLPLSQLAAVELPFERQRRVAALGSIHGIDSSGAAWRLAVGSVHLDTFAGPRHAWVFTGPARRRQVAALLKALPLDGPALLGGDLNTWFGFRDAAYREFARALPGQDADRRATFGPLRLDHVLLRAPDGWQASTVRLDDRYGSDHFPLLTTLQKAQRPGE